MKRTLTGLFLKKVLMIAIITCLIGGGTWFISIQPEKVVPKVEIIGPGDAIFNFIDDGYWWPGRTVEKWITIENIGTLPFDFNITFYGQNTPIYDRKGDGANVPLEVSWPKWEDVDGNDPDGKWYIKPGGSQKVLLRVSLPSEADNTCQGDQWELTFVFQAIQCDEG